VRRWLGWAASLTLVTGVAGYYLWMGAYALARDVALAGDGPVAEASVVDWTRGKGTSVYSITVEFPVADGRRVREIEWTSWRHVPPLPVSIDVDCQIHPRIFRELRGRGQVAQRMSWCVPAIVR